ncbi:MAG: phosphatase PAP2 family protein [Bauldia sp.]|nr:phosphatase PAP2 family protein [Bauldia sp.]
MTEDEARGTTGGWRWALGPIRILIIATAILSVVFLIIPQLDLWFSRQFYDADVGFPAARIPALQWLRDVSGIILWLVGGLVVLSLLAKLFVFPRRRPVIPGRAMLFLATTLALSAGLLVNGILKALWGRPRPTEVLEFGGEAPFVTAWHISDYCARNCSFVSGEASAAIWLVAVALVVPARFRRAALATALGLAFAFSLNRIAFGGHFLSDVLLAWTLTLLIIAIAYHFLYVRPPRFLEETAIDGALTRAGLWLRGLVARRGKEEPPLHPEAVAVLAGEEIPERTHENEPVSPTGYRAAGLGFAEAAIPDEPPAEHEPPHAWPEDGPWNPEAPGDDGPLPEASAHAAVFPGRTAAEPARKPSTILVAPEAGDDVGPDPDVAAMDIPDATEKPDTGSIESIDAEPDELPPTAGAEPPAEGGAAPSAALDTEAAAPPAESRPAGDASGPVPVVTAATAEGSQADTEASGSDSVVEPPAADSGDVDETVAPAVPEEPARDDETLPAETGPEGDDEEKAPVRLLELPPPDRG